MSYLVFVIIGITAVVSYISWQNKELFNKLLLSPYAVTKHRQFYRLITHGFVHANWPHLIVNMLVFWSFGSVLIQYFQIVWKGYGILLFLLLYLSSIVISSLYSLNKHKESPYYSAVGASGATSAVLFASMFFDPWHKVLFFGVLPVPGIVFCGLYLIYSYRMSKKGTDNIGHDAHFWGAVYGFIFPIIFKPELFKLFVERLLSFS